MTDIPQSRFNQTIHGALQFKPAAFPKLYWAAGIILLDALFFMAISSPAPGFPSIFFI
jgi:hypothetical protein